jgi:hypothetical protein
VYSQLAGIKVPAFETAMAADAGSGRPDGTKEE